jgi:hypothetical protein
MTFWLPEQELNILTCAIRDIEQLLTRDAGQLDKKIKRTQRKSADRENLEGEWVYVTDTLTQSTRYALFLALYAQFEQALYSISEDFAERLKLRVSVKDIGGGGLRRYAFFFKKIAQVSFPDDEPEWRRMLDLAELRNHLVHKTRWVSNADSDNRVREILNKERYIWATVPGPIQFDRRFLPNVSLLFQAFILEMAYRCLDSPRNYGTALERRLSRNKIKTRLNRGIK